MLVNMVEFLLNFTLSFDMINFHHRIFEMLLIK